MSYCIDFIVHGKRIDEISSQLEVGDSLKRAAGRPSIGDPMPVRAGLECQQ